MTEIAQKWMLITGAASGIGYDCALAFAHELDVATLAKAVLSGALWGVNPDVLYTYA